MEMTERLWNIWQSSCVISRHELEERFAVRFDEEKLKESLRIENETRKELVEFFRLQSEHYYPGELISHLYMMMGMHLLIGTQEFLDLIRFMNEDIQTYPKFEGKKILSGTFASVLIRKVCRNVLTPIRITRSLPAISFWTRRRSWTRSAPSTRWPGRSSTTFTMDPIPTGHP